MSAATESPDAIVRDRLGHAVKRAEQALIARKTDALREYDLTVPQYVTLLLLASSDGMSAAQLARLSMVTPQTMATVLANLEAKALVHRAQSDLHRKLLVTRTTSAGADLVARADVSAMAVERRLAAAFSDEERARFREYLQRCFEVLAP